MAVVRWGQGAGQSDWLPREWSRAPGECWGGHPLMPPSCGVMWTPRLGLVQGMRETETG